MSSYLAAIPVQSSVQVTCCSTAAVFGEAAAQGAWTSLTSNPRVDLTDIYSRVLPTQGGVYVKGGKVVPKGTPGSNPQGETPIRFMNATDARVIGAVTKPWFYDGVHIWKQDCQSRPTSKLIMWIQCTFYLPDVGDMNWRIPPHVVREVDFVDCTLAHEAHLTPGAKTVKYVNTTIGGKLVNKTVNR